MQNKTISGFQLSPQQKRLWLLQENSSAYITQCAICIEGNLNSEILKIAVEKIIERHAIIRTRFCRLPGVKVPVMVVEDKSYFSWEDVDLSHLNEQEQSAEVEKQFHKGKRQQFDLEQGQVLHLCLVKLSANKQILLICLPAICADTRTIKSLFKEIINFYSLILKKEELVDEVVQYLQFSEWQNQLLLDEDAEVAQKYWQEQKIDSLARLKLPFEKKPLPQSGFEINCVQLTIAPDLLSKIAVLVQKYDTSTAAVLLACWQILILRLTGSEIVVGTGCDRREYEELHDIFGLLATWIPIKTYLTPNLSFQQVLEVAVKTLDNSAEWQDYFVPEPVEKNNNLAFPIGFEFEEFPEKSLVADVSFSLEKLQSCIEPFKVKLTCTQKDSLTTEFYYDINYFSADTIQRLANQFQTLLNSVVENPDALISQLKILSHNDYQQLLEFNQTDVDYPEAKCIHLLFEAQAAKTPNNIAVVYEDEQLTYAELNQKANQLAHYLQQQKVKKEVVVGLCVERSLLMIIGLLGILKAGGAYLPLLPVLPKEALSLRLQDAQAAILLTQQKLNVSTNVAQVICIDSDWEIIASERDENPSSQTTSENLAYVLFTSGSTGKPKGVAIEHRQLFNYTHAILDKIDLPSSASFAMVSSFAADLGNTVIFASLCTGGCLHVISQERITNAEALANYCDRYSIDCLKIVPSHLNALLSAVHPEKILPKKCLILGGERLSWQLVEKIQHYSPNCQILNHYGPTEATVGVLTYLIEDKSISEKCDTVPLGSPLANTQVYILDPHLQPVPIGVSGELHIGGKNLARGYVNQPELTKQKFICNFFSDLGLGNTEENLEFSEIIESLDKSNYQKSNRLYKTGDFARYLPDGNIEFLGRIDDQVKIRGFRIELGEISTLLSQHPTVGEVAILAREEKVQEKRLVAYIVPTSSFELRNHNALISELRNYLKTKLPEYMIPSAFVLLRTLPLTPNGKLDRQALPAPEDVADTERTFIAPRTPVEEVLAGIWGQLLSVTHLSVDDNFFDLGGHSLIATQVISRIRAVFQVEISLRQLFESPTVAQLAVQIEREIRSTKEVEITVISKVPKDRELPLSFAQKRLWFLDQLEPGSFLYNLPRAVRLSGKLNVEALLKSLNEIVKRHAILRTRFTITNGQPVQIIASSLNLKLPVVDLQNLPLTERETEVKRLTREEAQTKFNLAEGSLVRTSLLRLKEDEHVFLLTLHHIVSDGWSTGVFIKEMAALYEAFSSDRSITPLPELPIQYADFAVWQRQWLQGQVLEAQLTYWKQQLSGDLPKLQLPTDHPRPAEQTFAGKTLTFVLPKALSEELKVLSHQENVTLFMTLLAAFKTLLYRYTGQEDIIIGSPIANRNRAEVENLIGFFVNTLVLRTQVDGNITFLELLKRIREVALAAYAHQDLPFEKLVEELQPNRDLSYNPLFQVMFIFQNTPKTALELPGLNLEILEVNSSTATFDLTLSIEDTEQGLQGCLEYNNYLFDDRTINNLATHYQILLESIISNSQSSICDLQIITLDEQRQLLREFNQSSTKITNQHCIHQLFEAQVELTPNAIALIDGDIQLTYQQLNQRANQVAHYLRRQGIKPETLVGLYVERSVEMLVGLLGILKASGAYLPLDSAYPQERLAVMLADAQVSILLTQKRLLSQLPSHKATIICLDDKDWILSQPTENPVNWAKPQNLAYVIYTSGSTGSPKGVMIEHHSLVNFASSAVAEYEITSNEQILQFASISFDAAAEEIFPCLIKGATLVLRNDEMLYSVPHFLEKCRQYAITVLDLPTAFWHQLISEVSDAGLSLPECLRLVIIGGEKALPESFEIWQKVVNSRIKLVNSYGPTETTVVATICDLSKENIAGKIPIGHPICNVQTYILDSYLHPVPIGVPGEMYIGGYGVARGYLNQPKLTAQKFIVNPYSQEPGTRLYKTGDLVRYRRNGDIEFIGRTDNQVKIRGFRIELQEIEAVLTQHPKIQEACVLAVENQQSHKRLVAYTVPKSSATSTGLLSLQQFLQQKLPEYMVPVAFLEIEALPLTINGKVDRKALMERFKLHTELETSFVPPQTTVEKQLSQIWAEILRLEQVGVNDNFFELGGDSILILQVIAKANQLGLHFTPKQLFQHQTIAQLATIVTTNIAHQAEQGIVTGSFPLTPIQRWFFEENFANSDHYNQAVLLEVQQVLDPLLLEQVVQHLLQHHDLLRSHFIKESSTQVTITEPKQVTSFSVVDLSALPPESKSAAITNACSQLQGSLNLSSGQLLRVALFNPGVNQYSRLFVVIHHLIVDGVSWRILLEDLQTAYTQLSRGEALKLPPKTTSFKQWAYQLQEYAQSVAEEELDYWRQILRHSPVPLPVDYPDGQNTMSCAGSVTVSLSAAETQVLLQNVPAAYRTQINDVLLAALLLTFAQWTGQTTLLLDLEGHGREELFPDTDISRTVGWFTTVFPVALCVKEITNIREVLKTIKEQLRQIPNRGIGYGVLRYLSKEKEMNEVWRSLPSSEVSFNYLGQFDQVFNTSSMFKLAPESRGNDQSEDNHRSYLLEINGGIASNELQLEWRYCQNLHKQSTVENLAQGFIEALRAIITHCQSKEAVDFTPSDFPLAQLSQAELDFALQQISF